MKILIPSIALFSPCSLLSSGVSAFTPSIIQNVPSVSNIASKSSSTSTRTCETVASSTQLCMSSYGQQPTELPDSLDDAALLAAKGCSKFIEATGSMQRCRVDFDTSVGDETYTKLKSSSEFMQKFVSALCYDTIPGLQDMRQQEMMALVQARAQLEALGGVTEDEEDGKVPLDPRKDALLKVISTGGRKPPAEGEQLWSGPKVRVYFPDEGSAALARRDWNPQAVNAEEALVPPCVEFSACGGVQLQDISKDEIVFFFCPKASEAESVEEILLKCEEQLGEQLKLTVFVNPILVDMGVTGFGMAGRMLRERLIDPLVPIYYLRTLQWGALTRLWPMQFSVWQEDENSPDGYRLIKSLDRLPSNPEVEDIYDYENGLSNDPEASKGFGLLNAIGDFVNGMTRL